MVGLRLIVFAMLVCACGEPDPASPSRRDSGDAPSALASVANSAELLARDFPILYNSTRGSVLGGELFLIKADGAGQPRRVARARTEDAVWSPDGSAIAFRRVTPLPQEPVQSQLSVMLAAGSDEIVLLEEQPLTAPVGTRPNGSISWSADGQRLAFASAQGSDHERIWTLAPSGGQQELLLPDLQTAHFNPAWARHVPTLLAYVAEGEGGVLDVWKLDTTRVHERTNLTNGRLSVRGGLRWSPSGEHLAFSAVDPEPASSGGGDTEIYLLELATGQLERLTQNEAADRDPTWSPDGQSLIISSDRAGFTTAGPGSSRFHDLWRLDIVDPEGAVNITAAGGGDDRQADWLWPGSFLQP